MMGRPLTRDAWGGRCGGVAALLAVLLGLSACGTTLQDQSGPTAKPATAAAAPASPAPPASTARPASAPEATATTSYVVQRGDTLHALSRRTGASVGQLASLNNLPPPYGLKVGQTLQLPSAASAPASSGLMMAGLPSLPGQSAPAPAAAPRTAVTQAALAAPELPKPEPAKASPTKAAANTSTSAKPATEPYVVPSLAPASTAKPAEPSLGKLPAMPVAARAPVAQSAAASPGAASPAATPLPTPPARSGSGFMMPVEGKIITGFGPRGGGLHNDGINIAAPKGTPVKAAEHGVVVYAGNELRGFGNMLLVQHEGGYMTAYAHLDSMTVQRGSRITRGQKIGAVGMSGNVTAPQLHFEIRQGKQPVDPEKQIAESRPRTAMIGQLR